MWKNTKVLVTGGASFIGSHLVDTLLRNGAVVTVADDLSSGKLENLEYPLKKGQTSNHWFFKDLNIWVGDLKDISFTKSVMKDQDVVFHLAALHGGRGYIDSHPAQCCSNMILDQLVFQEAWRAGVGRVCFASSACVYPSFLQEETGSSYLLKETDANPFVRDKAFADLEYGWAKLMGEMALSAYYRQYGMKPLPHESSQRTVPEKTKHMQS
jgi:nucleoside-diphosphate-sugar epimerase